MEGIMANYLKPVVFKLNDEVFGVDINEVQSIEKQINAVHVPNAMPFINGIINLRGEVVPVYSLKKKFGMAAEKPSESTIIISTSGAKLALEVDEVLEISDIDMGKVTDMPKMVKNEETQYLDRVANINGRLVILLDVHRLLSEAETESVKKLADEMQNK
jgi:purine-binding chemotaxis protein CheW